MACFSKIFVERVLPRKQWNLLKVDAFYRWAKFRLWWNVGLWMVFFAVDGTYGNMGNWKKKPDLVKLETSRNISWLIMKRTVATMYRSYAEEWNCMHVSFLLQIRHSLPLHTPIMNSSNCVCCADLQFLRKWSKERCRSAKHWWFPIRLGRAHYNGCCRRVRLKGCGFADPGAACSVYWFLLSQTNALLYTRLWIRHRDANSWLYNGCMLCIMHCIHKPSIRASQFVFSEMRCECRIGEALRTKQQQRSCGGLDLDSTWNFLFDVSLVDGWKSETILAKRGHFSSGSLSSRLCPRWIPVVKAQKYHDNTSHQNCFLLECSFVRLDSEIELCVFHCSVEGRILLGAPSP